MYCDVVPRSLMDVYRRFVARHSRRLPFLAEILSIPLFIFILWYAENSSWHKPQTNSEEQGPSSEADSRLADQEIPHLLRKANVNYHVHTSSPLDHILSQMNPIHVLTPYYHKIHYNIIQSSHLRLSIQTISTLQVFQLNFPRFSHTSDAC
jgi:hypothetical protein